MRSIINKLSKAVQVVLLAPIKLPGKALNILKYIAVGIGILESVLDAEKPKAEGRDWEDAADDNLSDGATDEGETTERKEVDNET